MRRRFLTAFAIIAAASMAFGIATTASAYPGVMTTTPCTTCHTGAGTAPVVNVASRSGDNVTYDVSSAGSEWAVFNGATRLGGSVGATGQFTVAIGATYTVYGIGGAFPAAGTTTVTPSATATSFTITPTAGVGGSVSPSTATTVASGASQTFTFTPTTGFHVQTVLVDGQPVATANSYTFSNVTANHTIAVTFAANTTGSFTVTPTAGQGGSISPSVATTVASGANQTFTFTPLTGYHLETVLVDGQPVLTNGNSYTFTNVTANHTILATFDNDIENPLNTTVLISASHYGQRRHQNVTIYTRITDGPNANFTGVLVSFQVRRPGSSTWVTVTTKTVGATSGKARYYTKLNYRGTYYWRVVFAGTDDYNASTSRTITVKVRK